MGKKSNFKKRKYTYIQLLYYYMNILHLFVKYLIVSKFTHLCALNNTLIVLKTAHLCAEIDTIIVSLIAQYECEVLHKISANVFYLRIAKVLEHY